MKYYLIIVFLINGFFIPLNSFATKIAPISLEELMNDASTVIATKIVEASISINQYKVIHSGEEKYYLNYVATIVDSIKVGEVGKTIEFSSREPLLVSREYLVFLNSSKDDKLFVAQAGFAAFEKTYISIKTGIKEGLRIPSDFISLPKNLVTTSEGAKLNEQSSYVWVEWLPFKKWQIKYLSTSLSEK